MHCTLNGALELVCFMCCLVQANGWYSLEVRRPRRIAPRRDGQCADSAAGKSAHSPDTTPKIGYATVYTPMGLLSKIGAVVRILLLTLGVSRFTTGVNNVERRAGESFLTSIGEIVHFSAGSNECVEQSQVFLSSCQKISRNHTALNVEAACVTSALGRMGNAGGHRH